MAEAKRKETYVNVQRITLSGGKQAGTVIEPGQLTSTYDWIDDTKLAILLAKGILKPVVK